jgi:hypothetical protein
MKKSLTQAGGEHVVTARAKPAQVTLGTRNVLVAYHGPKKEFHNPRLPIRDALQRTKQQELLLMKVVANFGIKFRLEPRRRALEAWRKAITAV